MKNKSIARTNFKNQQEQQYLEEHLLTVAHNTANNASKINLSTTGKLIGLCHDLGKYSKEFLQYISSNNNKLKGKIDHSTEGAQFIFNELIKANQSSEIAFAAEIIPLCIASHHSGLIDCFSRKNDFVEYTFGKRMIKELNSSAENWDDSICVKIQLLLEKELLLKNELTKIRKEFQIIIISILRKNSSYEKVAAFQFGLLARYLLSCLVDADHTDSANFENKDNINIRQGGKYKNWELLIERLENKLEKFGKPSNELMKIRTDISKECLKQAKNEKGLYTLTVPTGSGKTLASLRFALNHAKIHQMDRVIYVLPFTTIIDQNAQEVRQILELNEEDKGRIVLEHHSNLTSDKDTFINRILCENWDAPVVFTTTVQFLETFFGKSTRSVRRMHQLANSVIIFDEVQKIPMNCAHLFANAVNFLTEQCNSTVLLCSATQPLFNDLNKQKGCIKLKKNNELVNLDKKQFLKLKRVIIEDLTQKGKLDCTDIADMTIEQTKLNGSCLIVVNMKKIAKEIFKICESKTQIPVYHLSTNMCAAHRKVVLDKVIALLQKNKPVICVSTQLIEAGVDIDFDVVIRSLAGLDSIIQAAGRCNRNAKKEYGYVYIVEILEEKLPQQLKEIINEQDAIRKILWDFKTNPVMFGNDLLSKCAMDKYYEKFFYDRLNNPKERGFFEYKVGERDTLFNLLSTNNDMWRSFTKMEEYTENKKVFLKQAFFTAAQNFNVINSSGQGVIVPYGEGKKIIEELLSNNTPEKLKELLKKAQQYTVNVYNINETYKLLQMDNGRNVYIADKKYYSEYFGLSEEIVGKDDFLYV